MKLRVKIDQAKCFAKGLNAVHSFHDIEVEPASVPEPVRNWIAAKITDGITLDIAFPTPKPNQTDLIVLVQEMMRQEVLAEEKQHKNAKALAAVLTPHELQLAQKGRLPLLTELEATSRLIVTTMGEVMQIRPANYTIKGYKLQQQDAMENPEWPAEQIRPILILEAGQKPTWAEEVYQRGFPKFNESSQNEWCEDRYHKCIQLYPEELADFYQALNQIQHLQVVDSKRMIIYSTDRTVILFIRVSIDLPGVSPTIGIWVRLDSVSEN